MDTQDPPTGLEALHDAAQRIEDDLLAHGYPAAEARRIAHNPSYIVARREAASQAEHERARETECRRHDAAWRRRPARMKLADARDELARITAQRRHPQALLHPAAQRLAMASAAFRVARLHALANSPQAANSPRRTCAGRKRPGGRRVRSAGPPGSDDGPGEPPGPGEPAGRASDDVDSRMAVVA